jgi:hypothetical protein
VQNNSVWERACGLTATVVEGVFVSMRRPTRVWCRLVLMPGHVVGVVGVAVDHRAMTAVMAGVVGGLWMRARPERLSKRMPSGFNVGPMVRRLCRFRGRDTSPEPPGQ